MPRQVVGTLVLLAQALNVLRERNVTPTRHVMKQIRSCAERALRMLPRNATNLVQQVVPPNVRLESLALHTRLATIPIAPRMTLQQHLSSHTFQAILSFAGLPTSRLLHSVLTHAQQDWIQSVLMVRSATVARHVLTETLIIVGQT